MINTLDKNIVFNLEHTIECSNENIVKKVLIQSPETTLILFALSKGQTLPSHHAKGDVLIYIISGSAHFQVEDTTHLIKQNHSLVIPALATHSVLADEPLKMLVLISQ